MASRAESRSSRRVGVRYEVVPRADRTWELPDEPMPESLIHDQAVELLKALLTAWAARVGSTQVMRNLAVRWDPDHPKVGVDPDVSVFSPPPPRDGVDADVTSVRTWIDGHAPPILAVEVVSDGNPRKDYVLAPDKYAASGTGELWIFDPKLAGPTSHGGPFRLQLWSRDDHGDLVRIYAGNGPARSPVLGAFLVVVDEGRKLRIADDLDATRFWLTSEEAERAAKDAERAAKDAERAAKDAERAAKEAALARIAELEARLANDNGPRR